MTATERRPIIDGWFTDDETAPALIGARCETCGTYVFPARTTGCPNPACVSDMLVRVPLSRRGHVWSYTENRYAPPPPFVVTEPFQPYALAAVELAAEGIVVLGRVATGVLAADLSVGMEVELVLDTAHRDDEAEYVVYAWAPVAPERASR